MAKRYTAQELRQTAQGISLYGVVASVPVNAQYGSREKEVYADQLKEMLRQAADMLESEVAELRERLRVSSNAMEMVVQWLGKYPKWQECLRDCVAKNRKAAGEAADAMEREEKREKKYQYEVWYTAKDGGARRSSGRTISLDSAKLILSMFNEFSDAHIVRRPVGEWEEVRDGD